MTALVVSVAAAIAAPVPPVPKVDEEFVKKVAGAREKAVQYLKEKQEKDGSWESANAKLVGMEGGATALATLALLEAGVPANDPAVAKAVEYLLKLKSDSTYVVSLRVQTLARADAKLHAKEIQSGADWLLKTVIKKGDKLEGWSYPGNDIADGSNTHFAVVALHAAAQAGAKVDPAVWRQVRDLYTGTQHKSGGWLYHNAGVGESAAPSRSMTAAALVGLTIATKYDKDAKGPGTAFDKGMAYLFDDKAGEWGEYGKSRFTWWLTTAELGRLLGTEEFKSGKLARAWYREGCEKMLKVQQADGSFAHTQNVPGIDKNYPVISTACGLYLLGPPAKK